MINHNAALKISSALNKEHLFCYTVYFFYKIFLQGYKVA